VKRRVWDFDEEHFLWDLRRRKRIEDFENRCARDVRHALQGFIGARASEITKRRMEAAVRTILRAFQKEADYEGLRDKDGKRYEFRIKGEVTFNGECNGY